MKGCRVGGQGRRWKQSVGQMAFTLHHNKKITDLHLPDRQINGFIVKRKKVMYVRWTSIGLDESSS